MVLLNYIKKILYVFVTSHRKAHIWQNELLLTASLHEGLGSVSKATLGI